NRFNSVAEVGELVAAARAQGFHSISMDLIYGLPLQNWRRFERTLDAVIALSPDRLSLFNYAHMPQLFKSQRHMDAAQMPAPAEKLAMLHGATDKLLAAGYLFIGMDHFRSEEHTSELQSRENLVCRLLLEKKKK